MRDVKINANFKQSLKTLVPCFHIGIFFYNL